jgi:hypothetical protein
MQSLINRPFTPYDGQLSAGMNATQSGARGLLDVNAGQGATNAAMQGAAGLLNSRAPVVEAQGYQPITGQSVQAGPAAMAEAARINRGAVRNVSADTIASGMGLYSNPYEDQVVQNSLDDLNLQRQRSINNQAGGFTQAGAFGGSRQGVADSLTNEAYLRESGNLSAAMRAQGFNTAADLSGRDVGNRMQAGMANQNADMSVAGQNAGFTQQANLTNAGARNNQSQFNAGLLQQMGLANMDAGNRASEFGAGARNTAGLANASNFLQGNSQNLQAAGLLGNLGQQQQGMNIDAVTAMNALGTQEQQMSQSDLDRLYQQYLLEQDYNQQQIANTQGLLGTIPTMYAGATQTGKGKQSGFEWGVSATYGGGK